MTQIGYSREAQVSVCRGINTKAEVNLFAQASITDRSPAITPDLAISTRLASQSSPTAAFDRRAIIRNIRTSALSCTGVMQGALAALVRT